MIRWFICKFHIPWWLLVTNTLSAVFLAISGWTIWQTPAEQRTRPFYVQMNDIAPLSVWSVGSWTVAVLMVIGLYTSRPRLSAVGTLLCSLWWTQLLLLMKVYIPTISLFFVVMFCSEAIRCIVQQSVMWNIEWRWPNWRFPFMVGTFSLVIPIWLSILLPLYLSERAFTLIIAPVVVALVGIVSSITTVYVQSKLKMAERAPELAAQREQEALARIAAERESLYQEREAMRSERLAEIATLRAQLNEVRMEVENLRSENRQLKNELIQLKTAEGK